VTITEYISNQDVSRRAILAAIHEIIINNDKTVVPEVGKMMAKDMIIYKANKVFKYGLASVKDYMSLHVLPMYGSTVIYGRYSALLDKAKFQKGCINFKTAEEMPLPIMERLFTDCAPIDLAAIMASLKQKKKEAK
jgi:hypothetical protein